MHHLLRPTITLCGFDSTCDVVGASLVTSVICFTAYKNIWRQWLLLHRLKGDYEKHTLFGCVLEALNEQILAILQAIRLKKLKFVRAPIHLDSTGNRSATAHSKPCTIAAVFFDIPE